MPVAFARTRTVGSAAGMASQNVCVAGIRYTYINYKDGKPANVVPTTGVVKTWTVAAGSVGGKEAERLSRVFPDFTLDVFEERHHFDPPDRIEPERVARALRALWSRADRPKSDEAIG